MKTLFENPELTLMGRIKNILLGLFAIIIWVPVVSQLLSLLSGIPRMPFEIEFSLEYLFTACLIAPLTEEVIFRLLPLTFVQNQKKDIILTTVIASSVLFGWAHGHGYISILYQGVMGFVFACVYIKNGYNYWSSVILHSLWNLTCLLHPM